MGIMMVGLATYFWWILCFVFIYLLNIIRQPKGKKTNKKKIGGIFGTKPLDLTKRNNYIPEKANHSPGKTSKVLAWLKEKTTECTRGNGTAEDLSKPGGKHGGRNMNRSHNTQSVSKNVIRQGHPHCPGLCPSLLGSTSAHKHMHTAVFLPFLYFAERHASWNTLAGWKQSFLVCTPVRLVASAKLLHWVQPSTTQEQLGSNIKINVGRFECLYSAEKTILQILQDICGHGQRPFDSRVYIQEWQSCRKKWKKTNK